MNSMNSHASLRIAALAVAVAAVSTAVASDDCLRREMARTDGDPRGEQATLHLTTPGAQARRGSDDRALLREMARTDGDTLGANAYLPSVEYAGAMAAAGILRELARTDGNLDGAHALLQGEKVGATTLAGKLKSAGS